MQSLKEEIQALIKEGKLKSEDEVVKYIEDSKKEKAPQKVDAPVEPKATASNSENISLDLSLQKPKKQEYYKDTRFKKTDPSSMLGYVEAKSATKKPVEEPAFTIDAPEVEVKPSRYDVTHDDTQLQFILDNSSDNDATMRLTQYLKDYYKDQDVKFKDLGGNRSLLGLAQVRRGKIQIERNDGSSYTFTVPTSKGNQFNFIKDIRGFLESDANEYELSNDDANTLKQTLTKASDQNYFISDSSKEIEFERIINNFFKTKGYEGQFDGYEVKQSAVFRDRVKIKNPNGVDREFKLKDPKAIDQIIHFIQSNPQNRKDKENYKNQSANLNAYIDQFFTGSNIDRVLGGNLNLRALEDNEMEPEEFLLEVIEEDLGGFGFFDNVRRTRDYPDMSNEDIISTVRERMQAEIQNYKSQRTESLAADFVTKFKGDALQETEFLKKYRENKVGSYTGLEGELAAIIEKLNHGGLELDSEERNVLIQQYKEKAIELNQSGEDYTILINPNDGKKVRTNRDSRIQDLEDQGYVAIENEDLVDVYRSFEFGRLEDHYNENAFALSNIDSKLNSQVVISSTTPGSLEPQIQYVTLSDLEDYATDIVMGFGRDSKVRIFSDNDTIDVDGENSIDASKLYSDDKEILELVNLVKAMKEERFDLRKTQVALDRMYLLNESPLSIASNKNVGFLGVGTKYGRQIAGKSFIEGLGWWSERTTSLEGDFVTERTVLDEIQNQMIELDFDITEREQDQFDRTFGETINEGGFGMSGLLVDFFLANKFVFKPLKAVTGIQKAQQIWNADRYARNGKIFSTALLQNRANKANLTLAEYASKSRGFTNVGKSVQGQLLNTLVGTTEEALKFGMVMGDEKYMAEGGAFFLAGRILNPAFKLLKVNTPAQEQLYQRLIKGPAAFTTGSEGAQAFMNWGESLKGNVDYNNWVEDNFGDLDKTLARCGEHWVLGTGLGFTHGGNMNFFRQMKYINANNTKRIANKSKLNAFNVIKEVYDAGKQTPQFVVSPRLAKLINQTAGNNTITQEGLNLVKEFGSKKQNKKLDKNFKRFLEFENAHRQILNYQGYLNPGIAEKKVEQDNAAWIKEMRSKGEEVEVKVVQENEYVDSNFKVQKKKFGTSRFSDIEYRRQIFELTSEGYSKAQAEQMLNRLEQGQLGGKKAMWSPSIDGKRTIFYDVRQYEKGLLAHEVGHDWYNKELGQNVVLQEQFVKRLENIAMGIKMKSINQETGRQETLLEAINRAYPKMSTNPSVRQQELFGHLAEMMSKPEIAREMNKYYGFSKIGNLINNVYPGSKKFNFSTDKGVFEWLNTYVETINKRKSPEGQFKHLEKFVDTELTQKAREAEFSSDMLESKDLNTKDKSRDLFLKDQQMFKETGEQSILFRADKYVRNQQGDLKYKTKEEFQRSEDFSKFFMELSKTEGMFDNIIRQEGRRAGVNEGEMSSYVERVKDNLIVSANRFNPAEAGGSIFGYFKNTAIPFEGLRIRTEFLEKIETGEKGKKVELDKEVGEGKARVEIEAENSFRETSFENENIGIEAQLRYREYLQEAGLNETQAEAYMPTGKGIDVAKKLKIEAPEINIDNIDLTSYKNIRKTANEQTGDKVAIEYFNIKPELWSIMKSTPAKNLNKPARKSIQEKIEADVQTIIKLLPQGAQNLISERGENITPEVLKNTSTGNKKVLLQIPMLYTKTSRAGKNLAEYVKTPELIKYEKLVDPKRGTPEFEFKQSFENRFLAEFGIGENAFKGRNLDQRLKAIVSETIGSIHNQSVRRVMNDLLMPKNLINQAAAGKSSALASVTLEKLAGEKGGGDYITFLNEIKKESFSQLLGRNLRPPMNPEKGLAKTFIEHFTDYKKSGLGEFDVSNADLRQIAKEIHAQYKFGEVTPAVVVSKAVRAAEAPNKLENIERQAGLEPSKFELNSPEDIVEARAVTRVVTKALVEKFGDGVYEQVLMRGESGGKGVGTYPDFASMIISLGKSQNRFSLHESSTQAIDYHSDIKNSKGLKYTGPQKSLIEGQGNKKGQFARLIDKKTGEWSTKALNEAYKVGEFNKDMLKTAVDALRKAYKAGDITYSQARAWVEIHGGPMSGLIKLSGSFSVVPNMSVKQMFKRYGNNPSEYVLEHTTPAQYVKAKIYDYILNGTKAKKDAMDLTLADYHTTLIPKTLDVMVNKTLQSDLPSWHRPGMDPIASRYYEANHPSDFGFGLRNFKTGKIYDHHPNLNSSQKQKIQKQIKEANIKAFPKSLRKYAKTQLNSKNLEDLKNIDKAFLAGRAVVPSRKMRTYDFDDTLAFTKSGVRYEMPNPSGRPAPQRKAILLVGAAGAGKTTIIDQLGLRKQGFKYVNQDIALDWLSKNNGLPKDMNDFTMKQREKWRDLQYEAAVGAINKASNLRGKGDGVVIDSTGGDIRNVSRKFKDAGYDVQVIYVNSSLETALARNRSRTERRLTDTTVKNSYEKVQQNLKGIKQLVDFFPRSVKEFVEINTDNLKQGEPLPAEFVKTMDNFTKGYIKGRINAEQFATEGAKLLEQGAKYDFSEFNKVVEGAPGPLLKSAIENAKKLGTENMFVLTARPPESAGPIREFLKSQGLDIPLENITGLGNSTGEAKAMWMLKKFSEGYNDMYFVDDALANVKAVKDVLSQLDIKSEVQQALASRDLNKGVNDIMEYSLDIKSEKVFSKAEAKVRGKDIKRRRFFMPDSASDLELLIEPLYGKGKQGIENKKWFEDNFIRKWERGINDFNNARQAITNDYMNLRKNNKDVVKVLSEAVEGTNFTHDQAMRVYIWNKNGYTIPDLAPTSQQKLVKYVLDNPKLQAYAENVAKLTKVEGGLKEPSTEWWAETIASEIQDLGTGIGRKKYIQDFIDVKNEIFSEANLNKMESKLGTNWRETIEDMFDRMETGRTRSMKLGKIGNRIMNYLNGSTGAIMNFNTRSATLQLISTVNFVNSSFNNPLRAGQAFANQPQYWKDFMFIMNSDMLKQRRAGLEINVSEAELASAASQSKNPARAALAKLLKAGYLPTKIADSFAIAAGGATYYRNAIRKYTKEGLSKAEAERRAFIDFQAVAERTQQSSRADLLSKQQTSFEGRLILPFANTPMQMNRIMIKEMLDLSKGRYKGFYGENSLTSKFSKIGYYGFIQSLIFAGLQSGAFALMTNSDDDRKKTDAKLNMLNTTADSFLRGMGIQGAVLNSIRLAVQEFIKQDGKKYNADYSEVAEKLLNVSPTIGSKFSKLDAAGNTYKYNKKVIKEEGLTLNGPLLEAGTQVIEATTNAPLNRYYRKGNNIQNALDDSYYNWQRALSGMGWSVWGLGEGKDEERLRIVNKGKDNEYRKYLTKEALRREKVEKEVKEKEKKAKKANKQRCTKMKSNGFRCSMMVNKPKTRCHFHD